MLRWNNIQHDIQKRRMSNWNVDLAEYSARYSPFISMSCWMFCYLNITARHSLYLNAALNVVLAQRSTSTFVFFQCRAKGSASSPFQLNIRLFWMPRRMFCWLNIPAQYSSFFECRTECSASSTFQFNIRHVRRIWLSVENSASPTFLLDIRRFLNVALNIVPA